MLFIKDLARKVLCKEITEIKSELSDSKEKNSELQEEIDGLRSRNKVLSENSIKIQLEVTEARKELNEVQKENEILRKYYDLDKEPSDEIKLRIHVDLELNRVKEENLKLIAMYKPPAIISQPYPMYTPQFGRTFY